MGHFTVKEAVSDAPQLLAELLLAGLRNHQYLLDRVTVRRGESVLADSAQGE